jgi:uncharacterized surface protein with fasciclin (FAS1) repeats
MYDFVDYRNLNETKICLDKESIFGYIYSNPNTSKFRKIIEKAMFSGQLNDIQGNFTIFIPEDKYLKHIPEDFFKNMDTSFAKEILYSSILNGKINKEILTFSPVSFFNTKNPVMKLYVTNISNKTKLNNTSDVIEFDINKNNGIIHLINNILIPDYE